MTTEMMTTTHAYQAGLATRATGFRDTLASEWIKLTSLRGTFLTLGMGVLLSIAITAGVCFALGSSFDSWSPERQAEFKPILMTMSGVVVLVISLSVFGVLVASNEYSSGMVRLTLTVTPDRRRVLAAKLLLAAAVPMVIGVMTAVGMFVAGAQAFEARGVTMQGLGDADAQRMVFGIGLGSAVFPVLGFALGIILRSTAGGIAGVIGLAWMPQVIGAALPEWPQEHILSLMPQSAADSLTLSHLAQSPLYTAPAVAAAVIAAWLVVSVGVAALLFTRRDA